MNELDKKEIFTENKQGGNGKIPPDVLKSIGVKIISQTTGPWKRIEATFPEGVSAKASINPSALSVTYSFAHERMGELGRINARFTGDGLSLSQLLCGIRDTGDGFKDERAAMMLGIYETAKAAFGEG